MYDYLIVGSGLFGSVFAREATRRGMRCLVVEKRDHPGGNVYCEERSGIQVHVYGPHIFHTNDERIWSYVQQFVPFNRFTYSPLAISNGRVFNLPFNMNTFHQMWGVRTPEEAQRIIEEQRASSGITTPTNLEEQAISLVGHDIYNALIKGYTQKQWGTDPKELPAFIIRRLPVRFTYDNNYFNDRFQGIPIGGYNRLIEGLLSGVEVQLGVDYFSDTARLRSLARHVVYTGPIDRFFGYRHGRLEYRSLRFDHVELNLPNFQGCAGVNYCDVDVPYTRIVEHKHFEGVQSDSTIITYEYPLAFTDDTEPFYPVNDAKNEERMSHYRRLAESESNVIFGGRLAEYRYYDMHQVIGSALATVRRTFGE